VAVPGQEVIVAPAIRSGRSSPNPSSLEARVLLIFRIPNSVVWKAPATRRHHVHTRVQGMNKGLTPEFLQAIYFNGTLMLKPGVWIGLRSSAVWYRDPGAKPRLGS